MTLTTDEQSTTPGQHVQDAATPTPESTAKKPRQTKKTIRQVLEAFKALPTFKDQESAALSIMDYMKDAREAENQRIEKEKKQKKYIHDILKQMEKEGITIQMLGEEVPSVTRRSRKSRKSATETPANVGQSGNNAAQGEGAGTDSNTMDGDN